MPANRAAGQAEKRLTLLILLSHGSAVHLARSMANGRTVKSADGAGGPKKGAPH
jgi:hypothetical protein